MDDEKFIEPTRAWRRRQKERKIKQAYDRAVINCWHRKEPEEYWFLDPEDEEDMLDIWALGDDDLEPYSASRRRGGDWVIYIEGFGVRNPPLPKFCAWRQCEVTEQLPFLTDEEIKDELMKDATKIADNQAWCGGVWSGNKRHGVYKVGSREDRRAFASMANEFEEEGLYIEKLRLKRRFTKGGI